MVTDLENALFSIERVYSYNTYYLYNVSIHITYYYTKKKIIIKGILESKIHLYEIEHFY